MKNILIMLLLVCSFFTMAVKAPAEDKSISNKEMISILKGQIDDFTLRYQGKQKQKEDTVLRAAIIYSELTKEQDLLWQNITLMKKEYQRLINEADSMGIK